MVVSPTASSRRLRPPTRCHCGSHVQFSISSPLKSLDRSSRTAGRTFRYAASGAEGFPKGRRCLSLRAAAVLTPGQAKAMDFSGTLPARPFSAFLGRRRKLHSRSKAEHPVQMRLRKPWKQLAARSARSLGCRSPA